MIDLEIEQFLVAWRQAWSNAPANATIEIQRQIFEQFAARNRPVLANDFESFVTNVKSEDKSVRVRMFRPVREYSVPALIFMHGGSWIVGSPETHYQIAVEIARSCRCAVISVDYSLAPENPFPAGLRDCEIVVKWAFANAEALRIDSAAISVGGESAGANLAAALTLKFRGKPQNFSKQLLFYPPLDFSCSRPSFVRNAEGPLLTTVGIESAMKAYLPIAADRANPFAMPLQAADKTGLPPMFLAVAEHDPLCDDGMEYARQLTISGVPVSLHEGKGLIHGYLNALTYSSEARQALETACRWLKHQ